MMDELFKETKEWVEKVYFNADHLVRTAYWVKNLDPKASDALILAALTHDIERAFGEGRRPPSAELKGAKWDDPVYQKRHQDRSAKFASEFLEKEGADPLLIKRVGTLIKHHEEGGDRETDLLRDADSISFLEINAPVFISWVPKKLSKEEVREKLDYMFDRIGNKTARKIAAGFHQKALRDLEKLS